MRANCITVQYIFHAKVDECYQLRNCRRISVFQIEILSKMMPHNPSSSVISSVVKHKI